MRRETYYDYQGKPVTGEQGFVTRAQTLNNKGQVILERTFDENGNPAGRTDPEGEETYCTVEYTYDKMGNINREKYYDAHDELVLCRKGYAMVYREFDAYNRIAYEKFYGTDGGTIPMADGAVSYRYEYDDEGNLIRTRKFDWWDHEITE